MTRPEDAPKHDRSEALEAVAFSLRGEEERSRLFRANRQWTSLEASQKRIMGLRAAVSILASPVPTGGMVSLPVEPSDGLLMSMAMRWDHRLGCPGYYDQPIFGGGSASHADRLRSAMATMRQLHEEVVGSGFYAADREAEYTSRLAALASKGV